MRAKYTLGFIFALLLATAYVSRAYAAEIAKPTVDLSVYGHVSSVVWVTKDLDPVLNYWENLGLKNIQKTNVSEFMALIYRGKPAPTTAKSASTHVGGVLIEWIQPVTGNNLYTEFLKRHGDGILALGFAVKSDQELERQIQYFRSKGVEVVQRTRWKGTKGTGHGAYLDTAAKGGGLTIAVYFDPNSPAPGAAGTEGNDAPFNKLTHYAFVVRNDRKVGEYWQDLGFGGIQIDHNISVNRFYRGQPGKFEMDLGWQRFGDAPFEWVQSTQGPNVYEEYLKEHGEGFHHLGVDVDDMDAAAKIFGAKGAPRSQWGGWDNPKGKGRFAYLDTDPHGGVTLELIWSAPKPR
jgi:catechol 2,3-dioxygenase-like lactoylglutathione lyase family enzyme